LLALIRIEMLSVVGGLVIWQGWKNIEPNAIAWLTSLTVVQWTALINGLMLFALPNAKRGMLM
jgi:hypothetical protein